MQNLSLLIKELISLPNETEWLEFKHNNFDPDMIGADISALANSAACNYQHQKLIYMKKIQKLLCFLRYLLQVFLTKKSFGHVIFMPV